MPPTGVGDTRTWHRANGISRGSRCAGRRLDEMHDFFAFMSEEMPGLLERWRVHREARRSGTRG